MPPAVKCLVCGTKVDLTALLELHTQCCQSQGLSQTWLKSDKINSSSSVTLATFQALNSPMKPPIGLPIHGTFLSSQKIPVRQQCSREKRQTEALNLTLSSERRKCLLRISGWIPKMTESCRSKDPSLYSRAAAVCLMSKPLKFPCPLSSPPILIFSVAESNGTNKINRVRNCMVALSGPLWRCIQPRSWRFVNMCRSFHASLGITNTTLKNVRILLIYVPGNHK